MRISIIGLVLFLLGWTATAQAQDALRSDPGYVDLASVDDWFGQEAKLEVNIKGALLELVAEASRESNPELADLLTKLKAIQVRGYAVEAAQFGDVDRQMRTLGQNLEQRGWETVVRVREEGERVNMYLNVRAGAIMGMMVMVTDEHEEESVFVNIVGQIDPKQVGRLGRALDIDPLKDL